MASHKIKDLSPTIGECGKFQVFLTIAVHTATVGSVWGTMFMSYGNYNPGWTCLDQLEDVNPHDNRSFPTKSTPLNSTKWSLDCDVKRDCENLVYNKDSSTVVTEWDLSCDLSWVPSMIISVQMTGAIVGCYISGQIGDRFGRKLSLYLNVALNGICHVLGIFSVSWQWYTAIFFFIGLSAAGIYSNTYPYPLEFTNEWWRGVISSIPIWNTAFVVFALVAFALRDWQHVHIISAVICTLAFLTVLWTPESVRWLTVSGKADKAKNVVEKISRINKRPRPDISIIDDIANEEKTRMGGHTYTYLDLFRDSVFRGLSIKFAIIWASLAIVYYGISFGIKALSGDFYINLLISAIIEVPAVLFVAPMANNLGRRISALVYLGLFVISCITLIIMFFVTSGNVKAKSVLFLALISKMLNVGSWGVSSLYVAELYPTVVRSIAYGFVVAASRIGSILLPYLIPNDPEKLYVAFIILAIIGTINIGIVFSLPESKGTIMKDTIRHVVVEPEEMPMQSGN